MKKMVLLFTLLFLFSSSLISCRENPDEATEADMNEELDVSDDQTTADDTLQVPREQGVGEIDE